MSTRAWLYIWFVFCISATLCGYAVLRGLPAHNDWLLFSLLVVMATFTQLNRADGPNHQALFATPIFFFAGMLLLANKLFILLIAIPHLIEWVKTRLVNEPGPHLRKWYIQPFNIAMHIIAGAASRWVYDSINGAGLLTPDATQAISLAASALTYLMVNQLLLGQAFVLARQMSWRESGVLTFDNLFPEFLMICVGASVAVLWQINGWLIVLTLAPVSLMYRALLVPKLQEEAQTDGKTGLYNARYFNKLYAEEFVRAQRFQRPLAFIMADLDLLRNINNTYGHLAGDAVLEGIGKIIRKTVRDYDIAGRFGGEEFAIVLPEASLEQAMLLAERIRAAIEEAGFEIPNSPTPIRATMSFGVACFPQDGQTMTDLNHEADLAVYQAKFQGRNRIVSAAQVPHSVKLEQAAKEARADAGYQAAFKGRARGSSEQRAVGVNSQGEQQVQPAESPPTRPAAPAASAQETTLAAKKPVQPRVSLPLRFLIAIVISLGFVVALSGSSNRPIPDLVALALFVGIALFTELRQISVYGDNSMSVSMAAIFASGLVLGIPGVVATSAAVALADQIRQRRPLGDFYKIAFNCSTHIIAGMAPVVAMLMVPLELNTANLIPLALITLAAGTLYYGLESSLISAAISFAKGVGLCEVWQAQFRWLGGHYLALSVMGLFLALAYAALGLVGVLVFTLPVLMMTYAQHQYVGRTQDSVRELRRMNQELTRANQEIGMANQAIQQLNDELFETLARFYDARDPYAGSHSAQVANYATAIATELGLPPERIRLVRQGGLLHDIGKIAISEQILFKPDRLTQEEYETIKSHTTIGAALIESSHGLRHLAPFVRHHHERWDGCGYPDGLAGEEIPLEARILNISDSVEAMASDRPYHRAMSLPQILEQVRRGAGSQFDPEIAAIFLRIAEREREILVQNSAEQVTIRFSLARNPINSLV